MYPTRATGGADRRWECLLSIAPIACSHDVIGIGDSDLLSHRDLERFDCKLEPRFSWLGTGARVSAPFSNIADRVDLTDDSASGVLHRARAQDRELRPERATLLVLRLEASTGRLSTFWMAIEPAREVQDPTRRCQKLPGQASELSVPPVPHLSLPAALRTSLRGDVRDRNAGKRSYGSDYRGSDLS
jgi:hypothetical protein